MGGESSDADGLVHGPHGAGAVAHGGGHAFHGPVPHIPGGEYPGDIRLEGEGKAAEEIEGGDIVGQVLTGQHESVVIEGHPGPPSILAVETW